VQEPAPTKKQLEAMSTKERAGRQKNKLDNWIKKDVKVEGKTPAMPIVIGAENETLTSFQAGQKRPLVGEDHEPVVQKKLLVDCPICSIRLAESDINEHLDVEHL
jgi:hypothetical protein